MITSKRSTARNSLVAVLVVAFLLVAAGGLAVAGCGGGSDLPSAGGSELRQRGRQRY